MDWIPFLGSDPDGASADAGESVDAVDTADGDPDAAASAGDSVGTDRDDTDRENADVDLTRREALSFAGGAGVGLGGWTALDNVVLGYGVLTGTNLLEQDLASYAREDMAVRYAAAPAGDYEVRTDGEDVAVYDGDEFLEGIVLADAERSDAAALDASYDLGGDPVTQLYDDVHAIRDAAFRFEFSRVGPFFERIRNAEPRPYTVAALRGPVYESPDREFVAEFADADPAAPHALVDGIAGGFREYSSYDIPRYAAGSVEDNVLLGSVDLRQHFESPADFEALAAGENSGLFCTELVSRSIEAFHAVPAPEQSPPVVAGYVSDQRHKHAYTFLASAIRTDDSLVVPMTFVDYTHSTLYDDLHATALLGEGVEAYGGRHRVSYIRWDQYAGL